MTDSDAIGRTIQLFLVDGTPSGLIIASIHGWTGSVLVSTQSTFGRLLARPEVDRTGVYILYGPDPKDSFRVRAYIGEADSVRDRIANSAGDRDFWETAVVVTTADEALTKGHVPYLEARLIELTKSAGRVALENIQLSAADRRRLPEADRANMEAFLANLRVVLPVIGLDLLKSRPQGLAPVATPTPESATKPPVTGTRFELRHKSGVKAYAVEEEGEFVVMEDSLAVKDIGRQEGANPYSDLRKELIGQGVLSQSPDGKSYRFTRAYAFKSPSAAAAVILDRSSNGRRDWKVVGKELTYHEWQAGKGTLQETRP